MIGWFPTPYPDELFYSLCSRYASVVQFPSHGDLMINLFDRKGVRVSVDLPSSLDCFVSKLARQCPLTPEKIIKDHSLFSFYSPFLPIERAEQLKQTMIKCTGKSVHKISGITASTISPTPELKFCMLCVQEDRAKFGETYWHRIHQIPGVEVCAKHFVFLEMAEKCVLTVEGVSQLFIAEQKIREVKIRYINLEDPIHKLLLQLSRDAEWLLNSTIPSLGYKSFEAGYFNLLEKEKLIISTKIINLTNFNKFFKQKYPKDFLQIIQTDFDDTKAYYWLARIIPDLKNNKVHHPLRHLLIMRAFDISPKTFFDNIAAPPVSPRKYEEIPHFLPGPYPCLNVVCEDYLKPKINNFFIKKNYGSSKFALFVTCSCEFSYYRFAPDKSEDDLFRKDFVKDYGKKWRTALIPLWEDLSLSVNQISKILRAHHNVVKYQALLLGLSFPRKGPGPKITKATNEIQIKFRNNRILKEKSDLIFQEKRYQNREVWLKAIKDYPKAKRSELKYKIIPKVASWLTVHDKEWLEVNQPPKWKRTASGREISWEGRDKTFSIEVEVAVNKILKRPGFPKRICPYTISQEVSKKDWISHPKYVNKLPITQATIRKLTETREDFDLRKIRYSIEFLKSEYTKASFSKLAITAKVAHPNWETPIIKEAILNGVNDINTSLEFQ